MYHFRRLWLLYRARRAAQRRSHAPRAQKILILSSGKLGDLVCLTSVCQAIGAQLHATVDAVTNRFGPEIFARNPAVKKIFLINEVAPGDLAAGGYSHAFILTPNPELVTLCLEAGIPQVVGLTTPREDFWQRRFDRLLDEKHVYRFDMQISEFCLSMLGKIGVRAQAERRELFPSPADTVVSQRFWQEHGLTGARVIGMCLSAGKAYKLWPVKNFAQVADYLAEKHSAKILLVGSADDRALAHKFTGLVKHRDAVADATGQFKLLELAALLKPCAGFISVDTGPLYVADAMQVPVVDIAGPVDCVTQHPIGRYVIVTPPEAHQTEPVQMFHAGTKNERVFRQMAEAVTVEQITAAIRQFIN
ncbi:MAG: glycosyltransferase family 9 protein [Patescibacteria group bacterium]|nr:glycosyltransferase family 9 protein [Patescibacteria group bacterium]